MNPFHRALALSVTATLAILNVSCMKSSIYEPLYASANYMKVKEVATESLKKNPNDFESHLYLGKSSLKLGDNNTAMTQLELALQCSTSDSGQMVDLALSISELNNRTLLLKCFDRIRFADPKAAILVMNSPKASQILVPANVKPIPIEESFGAVINKNHRRLRPSIIPTAGEGTFNVIQDSEGRPVAFHLISGGSELFSFFAYQIVQDTFRRPINVPANTYFEWPYHMKIKTEVRMGTITVDSPPPGVQIINH